MSLSSSQGVLSALAASGVVGVALWRSLRKANPVHLGHGETKWLAGVILAGGVIAPVGYG